jgi:hypothetical protein
MNYLLLGTAAEAFDDWRARAQAALDGAGALPGQIIGEDGWPVSSVNLHGDLHKIAALLGYRLEPLPGPEPWEGGR